MLKITLHDRPLELRLQLEGRLSGAWVGELRQCWQTASSTTEGRLTVVDLTEVDFVDPPGQILLADLLRAGVRVEAVTPLIRSLVEEIESAVRCATVEEPPASRNDVLVSPDSTARHSGAA